MLPSLTIAPIASALALKDLWTTLASSAPHSFFLSWHWIGTWLQCIGPSFSPKLLTVSANNAPVAVAIVINRTIWRRGILAVKTWTLNTTGHPDYDCISTEYNGLLARTGFSDLAWSTVVGYFANHDRNWDEVQLDGVPVAAVNTWIGSGRSVRESRRAPSRFVKLDAVRATADNSCLSLLPARIRSRIRHTATGMLKRYGPIAVTIASSRDEARHLLTELIGLHNIKWATHSSKGAFHLPFSERFHTALINNHFAADVIQLARVTAGNTTLGIFYNFVYQGRVLFYQSGVNYGIADKSESPGLLIHSLLINHNAALGHDEYDLLAGDSQYKRTLATHSNDLWWGALQAPRVKLRAERYARHRYRSLRRWARMS